MHSILTYKMENKRLGCIDRDINACMNIKMFVECYLQDKERPLRFRRGVIID